MLNLFIMKNFLISLLAIFTCTNLISQIVITKYYEGGGTNKWIELTNIGDTIVDLDATSYSLGLYSESGYSGNISFDGGLDNTEKLTGKILPGKSILLGRSNNGDEIPYLVAEDADIISNGVINFNGNDGIALLDSEGNIIDRCLDGINAANTAFVRKSWVTACSETFITEDWQEVSLSDVQQVWGGYNLRMGYFETQKPVKEISEDMEGMITFYKDTTYLLVGPIFMVSGELTIEPGTLIKVRCISNDYPDYSGLLISRESKIFAEGTLEQPIIFTSEDDDIKIIQDVASPDSGHWGGVNIIGRDKSEDPENMFYIYHFKNQEKALVAGNDSLWSSGILKYVSIRNAGRNYSPAMRLFAVSSETIIEKVEVFNFRDIGISLLSGSCNLKYMVSSFGCYGHFDADKWEGNGQFWFSFANRISSSVLTFWEDREKTYGNQHSPMIYNVTNIGNGFNKIINDFCAQMECYWKADGYISNSIFSHGYGKALKIEDRTTGLDCREQMENGKLVLKNNVFYNFSAGDEFSADGLLSTGDGIDTMDFLIDHLQTNDNVIDDPGFKNISILQENQLNPLPEESSIVFQDLDTFPDDSFITPVNYKGAFGTENWLRKWTALSSYNYLDNGLSDDTRLLKMSVGGEIPVNFHPDTLFYRVQLNKGVSTFPDIDAEVLYPGAVVEFSSPSELSDTLEILVTAADTVNQRTYQVVLSPYISSSDTTLKEVKIDDVPLTDFSPGLFNYDIQLQKGDLSSPAISGLANHDSAKVEIIESATLHGTTTIRVMAEDGTGGRYNFNIIPYECSGDVTLADLRVNGRTYPGFDPDSIFYEIQLLKFESIPIITAKANHDSATVKLSQVLNVPDTVLIQVTAEDTSMLVYKVSLLPYVPSDDADLTELLVDSHELEGFAKDSFEYTFLLPANHDKVPDVTCILSSDSATAIMELPEEIPGTARINIIAEDSLTTASYIIHFILETGIYDRSCRYLVHPNPVSDYFIIKGDLNKVKRVILYSISGEQLFSGDEIHGKEFKISMEGLLPGMYLLEVQFLDGRSKKNFRIMKQ